MEYKHLQTQYASPDKIERGPKLISEMLISECQNLSQGTSCFPGRGKELSCNACRLAPVQMQWDATAALDRFPIISTMNSLSHNVIQRINIYIYYIYIYNIYIY